MKSRLFGIVLAVMFSWGARAQQPRLVVGIVVDQMRQEYLDRYDSKFGNGGFKRMRSGGFELKNAHYNYIGTETGPGHASVYTGTTPSFHGIIANDWYDRKLRSSVNCVNDPRRQVVGGDAGKGTVSPWRLLCTTITDELKWSTQKRSRIISLSMKDRGAVLPGGHMADGAYWYDEKTGNMVSSTYYLKDKLPDWVQKFNQQKLPDKYLSQVWTPVFPIEQYQESGPDESPYEIRFRSLPRSTFPYDLKELRKTNGDLALLWFTPFGNDYIAEFAKAALTAEKLGTGDVTDFLAVSFSATDAIGHMLGPEAKELEDVYVRLDRNLEDLLNTLDEKVGKGKYTVFLTADHGVAEVSQALVDNRIPGGYFSKNNAHQNIKDYLAKYFPNKEMIEDMSNEMIYFNSNMFQVNPREAGVELMIASELIAKYLLTFDGVANVYTESVLRQGNFDEKGMKGMVIRSYHPKRSGDLVYVLEPGWSTSSRPQGTVHGSTYTYDTHIPILFYGSGIKAGSTVEFHTVTDIAPTLAILLKTKFPSACTGQPVKELFE
jgi:predicted AlkP superfamily pyrophosphatase or phosphodiesterase